VLYVGKAKNLRRRLSSYRVANPERFSRRLIRLLNQVTRIEYDVCANERCAHHREELFICVLAPKFNRAGKVWPRKLLHDDDVFTYNRTVPKSERGARTKTATTKLTLIGGDKHGSQEKKESR
jgi:excinuclease UvrABC nuclease subunit